MPMTSERKWTEGAGPMTGRDDGGAVGPLSVRGRLSTLFALSAGIRPDAPPDVIDDLFLDIFTPEHSATWDHFCARVENVFPELDLRAWITPIHSFDDLVAKVETALLSARQSDKEKS